jgi:hypothetical protein
LPDPGANPGCHGWKPATASTMARPHNHQVYHWKIFIMEYYPLIYWI